tara:strand:- start:215 stop:1885 length:1671 start_codon:yes stop_codon:yes gene_type:complete
MNDDIGNNKNDHFFEKKIKENYSFTEDNLFGEDIVMDDKISAIFSVFKSKLTYYQDHLKSLFKSKSSIKQIENSTDVVQEHQNERVEEKSEKKIASIKKNIDVNHNNINHTFADLLRLKRTLSVQKELSQSKSIPTINYRKKQLIRLKTLIENNLDKIVVAQNKDFGLRHSKEVLNHEVILPLALIKLSLKELKKWVENSNHHANSSINKLFVNKKVTPYPYGCVGIITSWNFPFSSAFMPLISAIAAGNRVILKLSNKTPHVSSLIEEMITSEFEENDISVITGDDKVTLSFGLIPFDKLFYSGEKSLAGVMLKDITNYRMAIHFECSEMTPAIIANKANLKYALNKIIYSKMFNSGQHSHAPDYILVKNSLFNEFINETKQMLSKPSDKGVLSQPTYIINKEHQERLESYMSEVKQKGIEYIQYPLKKELSKKHVMFPLTFIIDPTIEMKVLNEEIFGPLISVIKYEDFPDAINYINQKKHSKSVYFFGNDQSEQHYLLNYSKANQVTFNDTLIESINYSSLSHLSNDEMTHFYGKEGFFEFSKMRTIFKSKRF